MAAKKYMKTPYWNLVEKLGEERAKAEMSRRAKRRKTRTGFALLSKEELRRVQLKSVEARKNANRANGSRSLPQE